MISRIPIRWRLALAFAMAMAVVLLAAGTLLSVRLGDELQDGVEDSLRTRSDEVAALVAGTGGDSLGDAGPGRVSDADEGFAQLLGDDGRVLDAPAAVRRAALLDPAALARARSGPLMVDVARIPGLGGRWRVLARPVASAGGPRIVVVGASLESRDEAVAGLLPQLLVIGPAALLLASGLGYAVAAAALRPVEELRAGAAEISGTAGGARLAVSPADDELRDLGETLNQMLARIDAAMGREREFVADAGHELRTPIAILKAEIDLALSGDRPAVELRAALVSAQEETARLVRLSAALLDLGRMDQGGPHARGVVDARELLEAVARRFATRAAEAGRSIEVSAPTGRSLEVDRARMEDAVANLVENSLLHGAGRVRLEAVVTDGGAAVAVSDEGPGFDPAFVPVAFERFSRPGAGRSGGGAGLGLAIVRATARLHGGDAEIAEGAGGARVTIRLP